MLQCRTYIVPFRYQEPYMKSLLSMILVTTSVIDQLQMSSSLEASRLTNKYRNGCMGTSRSFPMYLSKCLGVYNYRLRSCRDRFVTYRDRKVYYRDQNRHTTIMFTHIAKCWGNMGLAFYKHCAWWYANTITGIVMIKCGTRSDIWYHLKVYHWRKRKGGQGDYCGHHQELAVTRTVIQMSFFCFSAGAISQFFKCGGYLSPVLWYRRKQNFRFYKCTS